MLVVAWKMMDRMKGTRMTTAKAVEIDRGGTSPGGSGNLFVRSMLLISAFLFDV